MGQPVFLALGAGTDRALHENAILDQLEKASRKDGVTDTQTVPKINEAGCPLQGGPHDQQAPAIANLAHSTVHASTSETSDLVHDSPLIRNATFATHNLNDSALPLIRQ